MTQRAPALAEPIIELRIRRLVVDAGCDGAQAPDLSERLGQQVQALWAGASVPPAGPSLAQPVAQAIVGALQARTQTQAGGHANVNASPVNGQGGTHGLV
jgi:hypothetical protein